MPIAMTWSGLRICFKLLISTKKNKHSITHSFFLACLLLNLTLARSTRCKKRGKQRKETGTKHENQTAAAKSEPQQQIPQHTKKNTTTRHHTCLELLVNLVLDRETVAIPAEAPLHVMARLVRVPRHRILETEDRQPGRQASNGSKQAGVETRKK
jgi:hypothetical protein